MLCRVLLSLSLGFLANSTCADEIQAGSIRVVVAMSGRHSEIKKEDALVARTEKELSQLWDRHRGKNASDFLRVDFQSHMVVAVFEGDKENCRGFSCESINIRKGELVIRLRAHTFQPGSFSEATQAWGIFVIPRTKKPIVLELDKRNQLDDDPNWKTWKRLDSDD